MKGVFIHVSPAGNDGNSGTARQPVATLAAALAKSRQVGIGRWRRIVVHEGRYFNTEVTLGPGDSGLTIESAPGERPILYGGRPITGWIREPNGWFSAAVPEVSEGIWDFRSLLVNGRFAPRSRYPEEGALSHESVFDVRWMSSSKGGWERKPTLEERTTLRVRPEILPSGFDPRNAELTIYHAWDETLVGVKTADRATGTIFFANPAGHPPGAFGGWVKQARTFVIWNIREGMTRPGQWYLDRAQGRLFYWPLPGENLESLTVIAPSRFSILRIAGTEGEPVQEVCLRGLTLSSTNTPLKAGGFGACAFEGSVEAEHTRGLRLESLVLHGVGGWGARLLKSEEVRCEGCEVIEAGAGGVQLDGSRWTVRNTLFLKPGRTYPSAIALHAKGCGGQILHNEFRHTPYSAVSAGGETLQIGHNFFSSVMEELVDGACIYVFAGKNCRAWGNHARAIRDVRAHAWYLDEQSEDCRVEGNLAVDVPWALHMHMARRCVLRNNICLSRGSARFSLVNCEGFMVERNLWNAADEVRFNTAWSAIRAMRDNVMGSATGQFTWDLHDRLSSLERHSGPVIYPPAARGNLLLADARVEADTEGRVRFCEGSPAGALGIRPLDLSLAGRRKGNFI